MKPPPDSSDEPVFCLGGCGNRLTLSESIARGYGERCWRKLHPRPARRPRIPRPTHRPGGDQPQLPDIDQLELWSP